MPCDVSMSPHTVIFFWMIDAPLYSDRRCRRVVQTSGQELIGQGHLIAVDPTCAINNLHANRSSRCTRALATAVCAVCTLNAASDLWTTG